MNTVKIDQSLSATADQTFVLGGGAIEVDPTVA